MKHDRGAACHIAYGFFRLHGSDAHMKELVFQGAGMKLLHFVMRQTGHSMMEGQLH